jgi:hypothetical protein
LVGHGFMCGYYVYFGKNATTNLDS